MTTDRAKRLANKITHALDGAEYDRVAALIDAELVTPDRDHGFAEGIATACDVLWKERLAQAEANNAAWIECTPTIGLAIEKALHDAENLIRQLAARPGVVGDWVLVPRVHTDEMADAVDEAFHRAWKQAREESMAKYGKDNIFASITFAVPMWNAALNAAAPSGRGEG